MGIQVKRMKAGDPGVGFALSIPNDSSVDLTKDLSIRAEVSEPALADEGTGKPAVAAKTHTFDMTVGQPLTTTEDLIFVLSYCSSSYSRETTVSLKVTLSQDGAPIHTEGPTTIDANPDKHFKLELEDN